MEKPKVHQLDSEIIEFKSAMPIDTLQHTPSFRGLWIRGLYVNSLIAKVKTY